MSLIHNERTKLSATWFNALATAMVTAGVFAPLVALIYGLSTPTIETPYLLSLAAACFVIGVSRAFLRRLHE
jgi:zinc transporter ZupT